MGRTSLSIDQDVSGFVHSFESRISTGEILLDGGEFNPALSIVENRTTVNTPGYRSLRKSKNGGLESLPMNPFSYRYLELRHPRGRLDYYWPDVDLVGRRMGYFPVNPINIAPTASAIDRESVNSRAVNKSLNVLKNMKVNLGVAFATRNQTARLLTDTSRRVANALSALKRGNFKQASSILALNNPRRRSSKGKSLSDSLTSDWLSLQYGWMPLLNDLYGASDTLYKQSQKPFRTKVTASETARWQINTSPGTFWGVAINRREKGQYTRKYVYVFSYSHEGLSSLSQMGVTNPASVAWEILPWSFVIDWFIPIGNFLDSLDATLGLTFEKGCYTTFEKTSVSASANGAVREQGGYTSLNFSANRTEVLCTRVPLGSFPASSFPSFSPGFSWRRAANALALTFQRLKR